ncbi:MAG TPA: hypothetical protein VMF50_08775 [Candidatus Binataceae bacterium]|nr:hypothetical protein [Candidatus Binataceae bacterium]
MTCYLLGLAEWLNFLADDNRSIAATEFGASVVLKQKEEDYRSNSLISHLLQSPGVKLLVRSVVAPIPRVLK